MSNHEPDRGVSIHEREGGGGGRLFTCYKKREWKFQVAHVVGIFKFHVSVHAIAGNGSSTPGRRVVMSVEH